MRTNPTTGITDEQHRLGLRLAAVAQSVEYRLPSSPQIRQERQASLYGGGNGWIAGSPIDPA